MATTAHEFVGLAGFRAAYAALRAEILAEHGLTGKAVRLQTGVVQLWMEHGGRWIRYADGAQVDMRDAIAIRPAARWQLTARTTAPR